MTPTLKSYIQLQLSPMMTLGSAQGMMISARATPRHQKLWFRMRAAAKPSANWPPTTSPIHQIELRSDSQKVSSESARLKLPSPTKGTLRGRKST